MEQLLDTLIILAASVFVSVISIHLRLSPILGYLLTGMAIGKHGGNLLLNPQHVAEIGEFGVVFLLFTIGLELTVERVWKMRLYVFGFGGAQLIITTSSLTWIIMRYFNLQLPIAIIVGAALSLSSTAVVLQVLRESGRQSTRVGRLSLAVLLMQDLAVVPLLAAIPIIVSPQSKILHSIGVVSLKAFVAVLGIIVVGRILLRPLFSLVSSTNSDEVYMPTTLLLSLGAALTTKVFGLSEAMGAFVAGLMIAETEYRNKVEHSINPFKSLLLGLFFMTVGMDLNINFIIKNWRELLLASIALLSVKGLIISFLCKIFRMQWGSTIHSGMLLAQGGEFALVMVGIALKNKLLPAHVGQLLMMTIAISMAVTPILSALGVIIEDKIDTEQQVNSSGEFKGVGDLDQHVIIAGIGRVGRVVALMLGKCGIDYVAVDSNAVLVKKARSQGFPIYHGDPGDGDTLKAVGAARASAIILAMDDKFSMRKAVKFAAQKYKNLFIIARVEDYRQSAGLRKLGANVAIANTIETGMQIGSEILHHLEFPSKDISTLCERLRLNHYSLIEEAELFQGITAARLAAKAQQDNSEQ